MSDFITTLNEILYKLEDLTDREHITTRDAIVAAVEQLCRKAKPKKYSMKDAADKGEESARMGYNMAIDAYSKALAAALRGEKV